MSSLRRSSPKKFEESSVSWEILVIISAFLVILLILVMNSGPSFLKNPCNTLNVVNRAVANNSLCTTALDTKYQREFSAYQILNPDYLDDLYYEAKLTGITYYFPYDNFAIDIPNSLAFGSTSLPIKGTLTNYFSRFPASGGATIKVTLKYKKNAVGSYIIT